MRSHGLRTWTYVGPIPVDGGEEILKICMRRMEKMEKWQVIR